MVDLTTRRRKSGDNEENIPPKMSAEALRKKANILNGTLNILSDKNEEEAASIVAKQIDKRGDTFADKIMDKSQKLGNSSKMTGDQAADMMIGTNTHVRQMQKGRSGLIKLGINNIPSEKQIREVLQARCHMNKEDWDFITQLMFINKLGTN